MVDRIHRDGEGGFHRREYLNSRKRSYDLCIETDASTEWGLGAFFGASMDRMSHAERG